jgi:hypothetical protein
VALSLDGFALFDASGNVFMFVQIYGTTANDTTNYQKKLSMVDWL